MLVTKLMGLMLLSLAASGAPAEAMLQRHTIQCGGLTRSYLLCVPENLPRDRAAPLVVMFHGGGGTGRGAALETGWARKAQAEGFIAVFPDGTPLDLSAPARFRGNPQTWQDGSGRFEAGRPQIDDVGFVSRMLDELCAEYPVDERRIYATGFSNGASMTFRVGVDLSSRFAAIAPVAGAFWLQDPHPARPVSLCYITGAADPLNPLQGGVPRTRGGIPLGEGKPKPPVTDSVLRWAQMIGCPVEAHPLDAPEGVTLIRYGPGEEGTEVLFYTVEDCGHTWPGGKSLLPESMVGKTTDRLNATDVIWEFFTHHAIPR
jgi:polyhydroxybutyrate depolymerase